MKQRKGDDKLTLCLGVHDHQPVGNFDFVFDYATDTCYTRFIDMLLDHEKVKWVVHVSGPLLLWLIKNRPELLEKIRTLLDRGQVRSWAPASRSRSSPPSRRTTWPARWTRCSSSRTRPSGWSPAASG